MANTSDTEPLLVDDNDDIIPSTPTIETNDGENIFIYFCLGQIQAKNMFFKKYIFLISIVFQHYNNII